MILERFVTPTGVLSIPTPPPPLTIAVRLLPPPNTISHPLPLRARSEMVRLAPTLYVPPVGIILQMVHFTVPILVTKITLNLPFDPPTTRSGILPLPELKIPMKAEPRIIPTRVPIVPPCSNGEGPQITMLYLAIKSAPSLPVTVFVVLLSLALNLSTEVQQLSRLLTQTLTPLAFATLLRNRRRTICPYVWPRPLPGHPQILPVLVVTYTPLVTLVTPLPRVPSSPPTVSDAHVFVLREATSNLPPYAPRCVALDPGSPLKL